MNIKYIVPCGTLVWVYNAKTRQSEQLKTPKDLHYSENDWKTFMDNHNLADQIKEYVTDQHGLSWEYYELDLVDLPENNLGWTHILYHNARVRENEI